MTQGAYVMKGMAVEVKVSKKIDCSAMALHTSEAYLSKSSACRRYMPALRRVWWV